MSGFKRRFPLADSWPSRENYLRPDGRDESRFISPFNLEDMVVNTGEGKRLNQNIEVDDKALLPDKDATDVTVAKCTCGKTYSHKNFKYHHLARHQKKCNAFLNSKG